MSCELPRRWSLPLHGRETATARDATRFSPLPRAPLGGEGLPSTRSGDWVRGKLLAFPFNQASELPPHPGPLPRQSQERGSNAPRHHAFEPSPLSFARGRGLGEGEAFGCALQRCIRAPLSPALSPGYARGEGAKSPDAAHLSSIPCLALGIKSLPSTRSGDWKTGRLLAAPFPHASERPLTPPLSPGKARGEGTIPAGLLIR